MDAREANVLVHTRMADQYNDREPHFRAENRAKVRGRMEELRAEFGGRLLDVGCGTGFIIDLAADLFDDIRGLDLTPAMLARVLRRQNVHLYRGDAAQLPFSDGCFDVVSAYAFFHHLRELEPVLSEVCRVLRPGGCLYADLEPNRYFWQNIVAVRDSVGSSTTALVRDEVASVCQTGDKVEEAFGIPVAVFDLAEYNKSVTGGIDADEFNAMARGAGFGSSEATYDWFAGEGKILHGVSTEAADVVDDYLQQALPLSRGLYKYLRFRAVKS